MTRLFSPYEINLLRKWGYNNLETIDPVKPVEYITGHAEFYNLDFLVNQTVLIPRLESEKIVLLAKDFVFSLPPKHLLIADLCTGSGCLGISLAKDLIQKGITDFDLYMTDISLDSLKIAQANSHRLLPNNIHKHIHFLVSDLFTAFPQIKFDLIISNPPYIPSNRIPKLDPSVRNYEPRLALNGGPKGTQIINRLLNSLSTFQGRQSLTIVEIDSQQSLKDFTIPPGFSISILPDIFEKPRFLKITRN